MGYNRAVWVTGVESGVDGISGPALLFSSRPSLCPARGTLDGRFIGLLSGSCHGFTIWGNALCHFLPLHPPFCSPMHHSQPSPHHPCFHSRLHNHCTAHKGLSSQVQPRLARIKERFQLKMFFPFLLSFFFNQPLPSPFLFSLCFSCHPIPYFSHICCTLFTHVSSILAHFPPHISRSLSKRSLFFQWKNKPLLTSYRVFFSLP